MKTIQEIKSILGSAKKELILKYNIKEIGIFGSYLRQEETDESDLDILVEFSRPIGFFKFLELEEYLQQLLGINAVQNTVKLPYWVN